jgi:hypothetical protein
MSAPVATNEEWNAHCATVQKFGLPQWPPLAPPELQSEVDVYTARVYALQPKNYQMVVYTPTYSKWVEDLLKSLESKMFG